MIKFKTYRYWDNQIFRHEAFSILVPEGWSVSGGIIWRQHATMPGAINLSLRSADGLQEMNFLPSMPYYWGNGSEGSSYMGNEVRHPPSNYLQYVQQYIVPKGGFRTRIVGSRKSEEIETALRMENQPGFGCSMFFDAGIVQLEYAHKGYLFQGDVSCGLVHTNMMYGQSSWIADKMISTRYPKGKEEESSKIFGIMLKSFRFNLKWFTMYLQFVQSLTQYVLQDIYNAAEISRIIRNTNDYVSETVRRSYESQQASHDRVFTGINESIRGVNSYYDPYKGYSVEIPNGYSYVYANPLGEYIVTDNPNYNPNVGSNLNWTILNRM